MAKYYPLQNTITKINNTYLLTTIMKTSNYTLILPLFFCVSFSKQKKTDKNWQRPVLLTTENNHKIKIKKFNSNGNYGLIFLLAKKAIGTRLLDKKSKGLAKPDSSRRKHFLKTKNITTKSLDLQLENYRNSRLFI